MEFSLNLTSCCRHPGVSRIIHGVHAANTIAVVDVVVAVVFVVVAFILQRENLSLKKKRAPRRYSCR